MYSDGANSRYPPLPPPPPPPPPPPARGWLRIPNDPARESMEVVSGGCAIFFYAN